MPSQVPPTLKRHSVRVSGASKAAGLPLAEIKGDQEIKGSGSLEQTFPHPVWSRI